MHRVQRNFGKSQVVRGIDFDFTAGRIYGLLGPNGAGKTTTMRLIAGLLPVSAGQITLFGNLPPGELARRRLGYMPQQLALYGDLSCWENLLFFGRLYGVPAALLAKRCTGLLERTELLDKKNTRVSELSGGMKRRVMMASVLAHDPDLVMLDEPTAGVDPALRVRFWAWYRELADQGKTILVTTHHIAEASRCDEVIFLRAGTVLAAATPEHLLARYGGQDLEAAFLRATGDPIERHDV